MNIFEAANSGKPFGRAHWDKWIEPMNNEPTQLILEDLLAEDWEICETKIVVTESNLERVLNDALCGYDINIERVSAYIKFRLGLTDS